MASIWNQKGATLSDKSARKEFGLTQEEIIAAVREGKLLLCGKNEFVTGISSVKRL